MFSDTYVQSQLRLYWGRPDAWPVTSSFQSEYPSSVISTLKSTYKYFTRGYYRFANIQITLTPFTYLDFNHREMANSTKSSLRLQLKSDNCPTICKTLIWKKGQLSNNEEIKPLEVYIMPKGVCYWHIKGQLSVGQLSVNN